LPYIEKKDRLEVDKDLYTLTRLIQMKNIGIDGEVNYIITRIIQARLGQNPSYMDYNAAIGILECVKLELYRRRLAPYEDMKKEKNGDVY